MSSVRHEINILDATLSAAGGASIVSAELVLLDTARYDNPTYYFEVVADSTLSISFNVTLRRSGTSTDDATCNIPLLTTAFTRVRSSAFTPPAGATEYAVFIDATAGATKNVHAARIIVIDAPVGGTTKSQVQIEIGGKTTTTSTTPVTLPIGEKYWTFDAAHWPSLSVQSVAFAFEAVISTTNSKATVTADLQQDNGSFGGWTTVASASSTAANSAVRHRTTGFVPVDGRHYRVLLSTGNSKSAVTIYSAKIIATLDLLVGSELDVLEEQFLILNTADTGTGAQLDQTLFSASEWSGSAVVLTHAMDSDNASNSAQLIDHGNLSAVSGSTVTGANQQESSAITLNDAREYDVNVINSTGVVAASRIIAVATLSSPSLVIPPRNRRADMRALLTR